MSETLFDSAEVTPSLSMRQRNLDHAYALLRGDSVQIKLNGLQLSARQLKLLRIIVGLDGAAKAMPADKLARWMDCDDRKVRDDINELRKVFGVKIGSSRNGQHTGYYLITCEEELFSTCAPFISQAKAELSLVRSMCEPHELREIAGQLKFNLNAFPAEQDPTHAV